MKRLKKAVRDHRNGCFLAGCVITGVLLALILLGAVWTPYDSTAMMAGPKLDGPSLAHLFGTDNFGRDVFSRVLKGAGVTALVAGGTVVIGGVCGTLIGALTGYFGGAVDELLMRLNDTITAFPSILLALVCVTIFGSGKYQVLLVLGIVFIPSFARIARTAFSSLRDANFVQSVRLMGASPARILFVHILPNTLHVLLPAVTIGFNNAVLAEASMSFLGLCGQPPEASLGALLSEAQGMLATAPWYALCTGGMIVGLIFGVGLIGEGLQSGRGERNA
jgi:peptide/nickel transport system permease protein